MTLLAESDKLHDRVRAFAQASLGASGPPPGFDALAVEIARYQARHIPGFRRLVDARGGVLDQVDRIPAVPVDAFRLTRVAAHPPELDVVRFRTSGTTGAAPGLHPMRRTDTYRDLSLAWGSRALTEPGEGPPVVVALAPEPGPSPTSSLGFMMRAFMEDLDGRAIESGAPFDVQSSSRWLAGPDGVDVVGLEKAVRAASRRNAPLIVLGTSFALVMLLDALKGRSLGAAPRSIVMTTGGFKGRTREVSPADLVRQVASAFGIAESRVVGEYGMTELTSQLYEGTAGHRAITGARGVFLPPPWLRVSAVDPESLAVLAEGEIGLGRFVDLGNVDSAVAIVTQDLVRRVGAGVELLGRRPGAPLRGCSLAIEEMVLGAGSP